MAEDNIECMEKQIFISIIIPVYNAEQTIERTLSSIVNQDYKSIELIIVNDCSTDNSQQIVNKFIDSVSTKIKCIEQPRNMGVASARNKGLENAAGDYVYYVDADDTVENNTLKSMAAEALKTDADIIGCEWNITLKENKRWIKQPSVSTPLEAFKEMCYGKLRWNLWLFMVKKEVYLKENIQFIDDLNIGEDLMVLGKIFLSSKSISIIHTPLYNYNSVNSQSISKEKKDKYIQDVTSNLQELEYFAEKKSYNLDEYFANLKLSIKYPLLMTNNKEDYIRWMNWFPEANKYIKNNKSIAFRNKIIQTQALKKNFWFLKLYHNLVFKFVYGILYK